jgi:predicted component of type VI protein secretion system
MQAVLVMFRSDGERRSFSVTRDVTVIGRREDCDLRIPLNDVSRKHARLIKEEGGMRLEDLGSSNGTYLNGQRVEREAILQAGDSIQVGPVVFVLQVDGYPADEELNPVTAESVAAAAMFAPAAAVPTPPGVDAPEVVDPDSLEPLPLGDDPTADYGAPAEYAAEGGEYATEGGEYAAEGDFVPQEQTDGGGELELLAAPEEELEPLPLDEPAPEPAAAAAPIPLAGEDDLIPLVDDDASSLQPAPSDELEPIDEGLLLELEPEEPNKH